MATNDDPANADGTTETPAPPGSGTTPGERIDTGAAPPAPDPAPTETDGRTDDGAIDPTPSLSGLTRETAADAGVIDTGSGDTSARAAVANAEDKGTATTITDNIRLGKTRESIAFRLLWLLAAIVAGYLLVSVIFSQACWQSSECDIKDAYAMAAGSFATVFAALLGLVGSVVGFYFGSQSKT